MEKHFVLILRYINEVLNFARNHPHLINLLNIWDDLDNVRNIDNLVFKVIPKSKYLLTKITVVFYFATLNL